MPRDDMFENILNTAVDLPVTSTLCIKCNVAISDQV